MGSSAAAGAAGQRHPLWPAEVSAPQSSPLDLNQLQWGACAVVAVRVGDSGDPMYCYVWSFVVRSEYLKEFESAYGPEGDWSRLFRNDPQYIRTQLLVDRGHPSRFLTIDFWSSYER